MHGAWYACVVSASVDGGGTAPSHVWLPVWAWVPVGLLYYI